MKYTTLRPIRTPSEQIDKIEEELRQLLISEFYQPLLEELGAKRKVLKNATDDLLDAIKDGIIYFYRGHFKGKFNATLSRELRKLGAKWDSKQGSFAIPLSKLSKPIKQAIETSLASFQKTAQRIDKILEKISPAEIADKLKIENIFDTTLWKVDNDFKKTLKNITVPPQLSKETRAKIAAEYASNMKLDIKGWMEDEILDLRKRMEKSTWQGQRYESMIKTIKKSFEVSETKAKFLARQETNLLVTKFRESRYLEAGVPDYKWQCVVGAPNHPVRPYHKKNDQKIFSWNKPPVVNEQNERKNPGEDFNCRCIAIPIVKFQ